jgi:hypothetical protein
MTTCPSAVQTLHRHARPRFSTRASKTGNRYDIAILTICSVVICHQIPLRVQTFEQNLLKTDDAGMRHVSQSEKHNLNLKVMEYNLLLRCSRKVVAI